MNGTNDNPEVSSKLRICFDVICRLIEVLSFIAIIVGGIFAYNDYRGKAEDDALRAAQKIYREVDQVFRDYLKLAIQYPQLDGYSKSRDELKSPLEKELTQDQRLQQRCLYTFLTDVLEVAYVNYHGNEKYPKVKEFYEAQWQGWEDYILEFIKREAYRSTWAEIGDEFDANFGKHMNDLIKNYLKTNAPSQKIQ